MGYKPRPGAHHDPVRTAADVWLQDEEGPGDSDCLECPAEGVLQTETQEGGA